MGFFQAYRDRRLSLTARDSIATLSAMERFFQGGKNWTRHAYHRNDGTKCLVGAFQSLRGAALDDARYWLQQAIAERGESSIEGFNDSRPTFGEIAAVMARAKELAAAHAMAAQAPGPLRPPPRPALSYQPQEAMPVVQITEADLERVAIKRR
jgi:hypothetical protein